MAREVETLKSKLPQKVNSIASQEIFEICEICWVMGHVTKECPTLPAFREMLHDQANFVNQFKKPSTFSETYNPGWRNHPNFSWRNNTNNNVPQQKSNSFYYSPQVEGQGRTIIVIKFGRCYEAIHTKPNCHKSKERTRHW